MRVDDVLVTMREVSDVLEGTPLRRNTEQGEPLWIHRPGSGDEQPAGTYAVPITDFMAGELSGGGSSGYTNPAYPFILSIRIAR